MSDLGPILSPNSIAIVGASNNPVKRGYHAIKALLDDGYNGAVYPVNPNTDEILGLKCYQSVKDIDDVIDVALVCTPGHMLPEIISACGKKAVKGLIILSGGFAETGAAGKAYQQQLLELADKHQIRLIGPNTSGMFNTAKKINLVGFQNLQAGHIGILSQSGNIALSLVTEDSQHANLGFSVYVGVGNEADVKLHEYLAYFAQDKDTKVIAGYIEGLQDGRQFYETAKSVSRDKPIVLYQAGKTQAGQTSAASHTGALAGNYVLSQHLLKQAGVITVDSPDKLLPIATTLHQSPHCPGARVAILADGGGHATIAVDQVIESQLVLAQLSERTKESLQAILPAAASIKNPVDFAGGADQAPSCFQRCVEILLADDAVDAVLVVGLLGGYAVRFGDALLSEEIATVGQIAALMKQYQKPIIVQSLYAHAGTKPIRVLMESGLAAHASVNMAVDCLRALVNYSKYTAQQATLPPEDISRACYLQSTEKIFAKAIAEGRSFLLETEARDLLSSCGISLPEAYFIPRGQAIETLDTNFDFDRPLAVKVVSKDILHKSDANGVMLDVQGKEHLTNAIRMIEHNVTCYKKNADIAGVLVSPMVNTAGVELILGAMTDPQFGKVLMFGIGGIFVEVIKDVVFRSIPITASDAEAMLDELIYKEMLTGVRGYEPCNRALLIDVMLKLSQVIKQHPIISAIELNPLKCDSATLSILDARVILDLERPV